MNHLTPKRSALGLIFFLSFVPILSFLFFPSALFAQELLCIDNDYAGGGIDFRSNGTRAESRFNKPAALVTDAQDNLYVIDRDEKRILKFDTGGNFVEIAGGGAAKPPTDELNITEANRAYLGTPVDIAVDSSGNVYVAEQYNYFVRKITPEGTISVVAGNGISNFTENGVRATEASFSFITAVAIDSGGNLYIADQTDRRVTKVDALTGILTFYAGTGSYSGNATATKCDGRLATAVEIAPTDMAIGPNGDLYILTQGVMICRVDSAGRIHAVVNQSNASGATGDGGPALDAKLKSSSEIAFDKSGNLFIAEEFGFRIRRVDATSGTIVTLAGNGVQGRRESDDGGPAIAAQLDKIGGLALDGDGYPFLAETDKNFIRKVSPCPGVVFPDPNACIIETVAGKGQSGNLGDGGPATQAQFIEPTGIALDSTGSLFIADRTNQCIRRVGPDRNISCPIIAPSGTEPYGLRFNASGELLVANNAFAGGVLKYAGSSFSTLASGFKGATGVAPDSQGNIYFTQYAWPSNITRIGTDSSMVTINAASLAYSRDLIVDSEDRVLFAETENNRIFRFTLDEATNNWLVETVLSGGVLKKPSALAIGPDNLLYIANKDEHTIRRLEADGSLTIYAGTGYPGFFEDGVPAINARLNSPMGLAFDATGKLYIADSSNKRIRRVSCPPPPEEEIPPADDSPPPPQEEAPPIADSPPPQEEATPQPDADPVLVEIDEPAQPVTVQPEAAEPVPAEPETTQPETAQVETEQLLTGGTEIQNTAPESEETVALLETGMVTDNGNAPDSPPVPVLEAADAAPSEMGSPDIPDTFAPLIDDSLPSPAPVDGSAVAEEGTSSGGPKTSPKGNASSDGVEDKAGGCSRR
ncbi:MAG: hypothetical protein Q7T11_06610, partial [Deltaproteobacteria bacterium]|nr:hypothetical protein [Deltaproteobacteria bacterium]